MDTHPTPSEDEQALILSLTLLWITEMELIGSATFDSMPKRSVEPYPTPIETAFERDMPVVSE